MAEEDKYVGEFEKRIGNLSGIEKIFVWGPRIEFSILNGTRRVIQMFRGEQEGYLPARVSSGVDLESALIDLDQVCLGQDVPVCDLATASNIPGNRIEEWLLTKGHIIIRTNEENEKLIKFEGSKIKSYAFDIEINMHHAPISEILSVANSTIIPYLLEKQIEIPHR